MKVKTFDLQTIEGEILLESLSLLDGFYGRLMGLMGNDSLQGKGVILSPCQSIHTFFMKFDLQVLFLSSNFEVIKIINRIKPWRVSGFYFRAKYVVECSPEEDFSRFAVGDKLLLKESRCQHV